MTPVEWMALLFAISVITKVIIIYTSPKFIPKVTKYTLKSWMFTKYYPYISLAFFLGLLWLLLKEISIVQFAAAFFVSVIILGHTFSLYPRAIGPLYTVMFKNTKRLLPMFIIFVTIAVLVLKELFF
jgi:hypothetical protein